MVVVVVVVVVLVLQVIAVEAVYYSCCCSEGVVENEALDSDGQSLALPWQNPSSYMIYSLNSLKEVT